MVKFFPHRYQVSVPVLQEKILQVAHPAMLVWRGITILRQDHGKYPGFITDIKHMICCRSVGWFLLLIDFCYTIHTQREIENSKAITPIYARLGGHDLYGLKIFGVKFLKGHHNNKKTRCPKYK